MQKQLFLCLSRKVAYLEGYGFSSSQDDVLLPKRLEGIVLKNDNAFWFPNIFERSHAFKTTTR